MRTIVQELTAELLCDEIITKHSITIYLDGNEVLVSYSFPEYRNHNDYVLNIYQGYTTVEDFANEFALWNVWDVHKIMPEQLFHRYERGEASIYCDLGKVSKEHLHFRKDDVVVYATNYIGIVHLVLAQLEKADDFFKYTLEYYLRLAN